MQHTIIKADTNQTFDLLNPLIDIYFKLSHIEPEIAENLEENINKIEQIIIQKFKDLSGEQTYSSGLEGVVQEQKSVIEILEHRLNKQNEIINEQETIISTQADTIDQLKEVVEAVSYIGDGFNNNTIANKTIQLARELCK